MSPASDFRDSRYVKSVIRSLFTTCGSDHWMALEDETSRVADHRFHLHHVPEERRHTLTQAGNHHPIHAVARQSGALLQTRYALAALRSALAGSAAVSRRTCGGAHIGPVFGALLRKGAPRGHGGPAWQATGSS